MSKIDELIAELCPDGVEYKELRNISIKISDGMHNLPKTVLHDTGYPVISAQNIHDNKVDFETFKHVEKEVFLLENKRTNAEAGDVLLTIVGAIGRTALFPKGKKALFQRSVCVIKPDRQLIDSSYLKYALDSKEIQDIIEIQAHGAAQKGIYIKQVEKLKVPVPPLEVQREIVRVLDNFTFLSAELQARKKQYEFYRDMLLGVPAWECEEVILSDVAIYSNDRISAIKVDEDTYVGVDNLLQFKQGKTKSEHVPKEGNLTKYSPNDILIGNIRPYLRKIWFADNVGGTNGDVLVIRTISDKILPKYLYCILSSERFFEYDNGKSKGAKMPRGDKESIMNYSLRIPSIDIQQKVVKTLENFDSICNDLNIGLPAEIEARQKQYEYYRDLLLTFAEKGDSILQTDRQTDRQTDSRLK